MKKAISKKESLLGSILLPLVFAQFICSCAGSNMNVAVTSIANDLGSSVHGVQIAITLFTLTMAASMLPGSKLTDIWGRKFCFRIGLIIYGLGALVGAMTPGMSLPFIGHSFKVGIGSALLIPPVHILTTVPYVSTGSRARAFGGISAAGGMGAAAGWDRSRSRFIMADDGELARPGVCPPQTREKVNMSKNGRVGRNEMISAKLNGM